MTITFKFTNTGVTVKPKKKVRPIKIRKSTPYDGKSHVIESEKTYNRKKLKKDSET